jgi:hypothetical protein
MRQRLKHNSKLHGCGFELEMELRMEEAELCEVFLGAKRNHTFAAASGTHKLFSAGTS